MPIEHQEPAEDTVAIDEVIAHVGCSNPVCGARVGDPCKNKKGEVVAYVHQPRIRAYVQWRAQRADADEIAARAAVSDLWDSKKEPAQRPIKEPIKGRLGPQVHQPVEGHERLNWMARYEMVRGVFRIMSKIDPNGAEGALDYLARLVVELDLDLQLIDEANVRLG